VLGAEGVRTSGGMLNASGRESLELELFGRLLPHSSFRYRAIRCSRSVIVSYAREIEQPRVFSVTYAPYSAQRCFSSDTVRADLLFTTSSPITVSFRAVAAFDKLAQRERAKTCPIYTFQVAHELET
jgi:hypothetical protein